MKTKNGLFHSAVLAEVIIGTETMIQVDSDSYC